MEEKSKIYTIESTIDGCLLLLPAIPILVAGGIVLWLTSGPKVRKKSELYFENLPGINPSEYASAILDYMRQKYSGSRYGIKTESIFCDPDIERWVYQKRVLLPGRLGKGIAHLRHHVTPYGAGTESVISILPQKELEAIVNHVKETSPNKLSPEEIVRNQRERENLLSGVGS